MIIEQTVEIPTDHRLVLEMDIPDDVPAGLMGLLTFSVNTDSPESASRQTGRYAPKKIDREKADAALEQMCGMFKTDGHDVERFLAWKQSERELEWEIDEQRRRESETHMSKETIATMLRNSVVNKNINPEIRAEANRKLCGCQAGGDGNAVEHFMERKRFEREHEYAIEERQREESKKWQKN
jgi:hypothetical protein